MSDSEMYVEGDEDGSVSIVCRRPSCMKPGRVTEYNPDGLYLRPVQVQPHQPNPEQIAQAWIAHVISHGVAERTAARDADRRARETASEGSAA